MEEIIPWCKYLIFCISISQLLQDFFHQLQQGSVEHPSSTFPSSVQPSSRPLWGTSRRNEFGIFEIRVRPKIWGFSRCEKFRDVMWVKDTFLKVKNKWSEFSRPVVFLFFPWELLYVDLYDVFFDIIYICYSHLLPLVSGMIRRISMEFRYVKNMVA